MSPPAAGAPINTQCGWPPQQGLVAYATHAANPTSQPPAVAELAGQASSSPRFAVRRTEAVRLSVMGHQVTENASNQTPVRTSSTARSGSGANQRNLAATAQ